MGKSDRRWAMSICIPKFFKEKNNWNLFLCECLKFCIFLNGIDKLITFCLVFEWERECWPIIYLLIIYFLIFWVLKFYRLFINVLCLLKKKRIFIRKYFMKSIIYCEFYYLKKNLIRGILPEFNFWLFASDQ